jgi:DNA-binding MurR/RpiR family transcriptional regulator
MQRIYLIPIVLTALAATTTAQKQTEKRLPYTAVHDPHFIAASSASFLHEADRVIGIVNGREAKAYPAAILSQHGLVEDQSPSGPIAITW